MALLFPPLTPKTQKHKRHLKVKEHLHVWKKMPVVDECSILIKSHIFSFWSITSRKHPTAGITGGTPSRTASTHNFVTSINSARLKTPSQRLVSKRAAGK